MTKWRLFEAFTGRKKVMVNGLMGYIHSIELEDGSGSSFNIKLRELGGQMATLYVRTID